MTLSDTLEAATKQYGIPILMSGQFVRSYTRLSDLRLALDGFVSNANTSRSSVDISRVRTGETPVKGLVGQVSYGRSRAARRCWGLPPPHL